MLRLPRFSYRRPASAREAAAMVAEDPEQTLLLAGGTDLLPKLKRRQLAARVLVDVRHLAELAGIRPGPAGAVEVGGGVTLAAAAGDRTLVGALPGYATAAGQVSSPPLREAGTIGGNLCVDTRCNYYDMGEEWRRAIGYCLKKDGVQCLVAPGSSRCWAVSSSDTAPMAIALQGVVVLVGPDGERELPVADLYRDDGIDYLAKRPHEVVARLRLPAPPGRRSAYVKLRRRGSIDFPIAGAAVALDLDGPAIVSARIVLSAVGSSPVEAVAAEAFLTGRRWDEETVLEGARLAAGPAKPLDNADGSHFWRKRMVRVVVEQALRAAAPVPSVSVAGTAGAT